MIPNSSPSYIPAFHCLSRSMYIYTLLIIRISNPQQVYVTRQTLDKFYYITNPSSQQEKLILKYHHKLTISASPPISAGQRGSLVSPQERIGRLRARLVESKSRVQDARRTSRPTGKSL